MATDVLTAKHLLFLTSVASDDFVYPSPSDSVTRNTSSDGAAVALTKVGEGWLAYIGDVNKERGLQTVIFSILGTRSQVFGMQIAI